MVYLNAWKQKGSLRKRRTLSSFLFSFLLLYKKKIFDDKKRVTQTIKESFQRKHNKQYFVFEELNNSQHLDSICKVL